MAYRHPINLSRPRGFTTSTNTRLRLRLSSSVAIARCHFTPSWRLIASLYVTGSFSESETSCSTRVCWFELAWRKTRSWNACSSVGSTGLSTEYPNVLLEGMCSSVGSKGSRIEYTSVLLEGMSACVLCSPITCRSLSPNLTVSPAELSSGHSTTFYDNSGQALQLSGNKFFEHRYLTRTPGVVLGNDCCRSTSHC